MDAGLFAGLPDIGSVGWSAAEIRELGGRVIGVDEGSNRRFAAGKNALAARRAELGIEVVLPPGRADPRRDLPTVTTRPDLFGVVGYASEVLTMPPAYLRAVDDVWFGAGLAWPADMPAPTLAEYYAEKRRRHLR